VRARIITDLPPAVLRQSANRLHAPPVTDFYVAHIRYQQQLIYLANVMYVSSPVHQHMTTATTIIPTSV
jgi:hypothetical protein